MVSPKVPTHYGSLVNEPHPIQSKYDEMKDLLNDGWGEVSAIKYVQSNLFIQPLMGREKMAFEPVTGQPSFCREHLRKGKKYEHFHPIERTELH